MTVQSSAPDIGAFHDIGAFLSVFAALLLDNVLRLEETADQVTQLVMRSDRPDRELVVTLQGFDRLKQEFEALGDALGRYAEATNALPAAGEQRAQLGRDVIAAVTVGDLRDRFLSHFKDDLPIIAVPFAPEGNDAEVGVDVVF